MSELLTVESIKAAYEAGKNQCDTTHTRTGCQRCSFRDRAPEMVPVLLAELAARSFSEADKELLANIAEWFDGVWAAKGFSEPLKELIERIGS